MPETSESEKIAGITKPRPAPGGRTAFIPNRLADFCSNYPGVSFLISAGFLAVSWAAAGTPRISTFSAAMAGAGAVLAWYGLKLRTFRAAADRFTAADNIRGLGVTETGLPILDNHLKQVTRKIVELLEVIESVESNSEDILERYRIVTQNIAASIVIRDINGKLVYANPYTEVLTGYPLKDALNGEKDLFSRIIIDEDREKYERALKISSMGEGYNLIYRALHKTGMEMWFETRTEPVLGDEGEVRAFLSVTMDITRLMRYQKQVEEKNRDLQDFAYMVSHDLKAPIVTIRGMIGLLEEDLKGKVAQEEEETFEHIRLAIGRLDQLVASVLQYSRVSAAETSQEDVTLGDVFKDILNDYSAQIKQAGATVQLLDGVAAAVVSADRLKLYQIFGNLVGNAIKFRNTLNSPVVEISTAPTRLPREIVICVSDNGVGIPAEKLESIFRPFHRAHGKAFEGTGIGLACVKRLLEKVGGSIRVESRENEGSRFFVSLRKSIKQDPLAE